MATAAPFVKLLRQLSSAKDEYRSGAIDIAWDDGKASIYLVFGQPNHATFEGADGKELEGQDAVTALVTQLPRKFKVEPFRKTVVRTETLNMTLDELMEPFAQLAGAASEEATPPPATAVGGSEVGTGFEADLDFGLEDFPLLPLGQSLWADAAANVVHLDILIPKLPDALIVLTGPKLRAAAIVVKKQLIDAVWVDDQEKALGEGAAMALMGARDGTVSGYKLESGVLAEALTMLWRCPVQFKDMRTGWLDADGFIAEIAQEKRDCALVVDGPTRGVGLFMQGELVAAYTDSDRQPAADLDRVRALLRQPGGTFVLRYRAIDRGPARHVSEDDYHAFVQAPAAQPAPEPVHSANLLPEAAATIQTPAAELPVETPAAEVPVAEPAEATEVAAGEAATAEPVAAAETAYAEPAVSEPAYGEPAEAEPVAAEPAAAEPAEMSEAVAPESAFPATEPFEAAPVAEPEAETNGTGQPSWEAWGEEPAAAAAAEAPAADSALSSWGQTFEPDAQLVQEAAAHTEDGSLAPGEEAYGAVSTGQLFGAGWGDESTTAVAGGEPGQAEDEGEGDGELDYETVKADLIQIGVLWLGNDDVAPVADLIRKTRPSVDDFVDTIDKIKGLTIAGHDPSVVRAMAREMHYHAAEYLCGA